ncbi:hypothetical protein ABZ260_19615 [Streptosporangium sp. NPDC006013]|uniref:hypothetical protein n=1 Tax=Streptosporangium sp. NPDC006013 TaxID=3155596 RepID=UPI0033BC2634
MSDPSRAARLPSRSARTGSPSHDSAVVEAFELFAGVDSRMTLSVQWAAAVLHNGLGNYQAALEAARTAVARGHLGMSGLALPELVEAAVRCGSPDVAESALADLRERAQAGGDAWLTGIGAEAFAERATGEHARSRSSAASEQLTMQEVHIARPGVWHGSPCSAPPSWSWPSHGS